MRDVKEKQRREEIALKLLAAYISTNTNAIFDTVDEGAIEFSFEIADKFIAIADDKFPEGESK